MAGAETPINLFKQPEPDGFALKGEHQVCGFYLLRWLLAAKTGAKSLRHTLALWSVAGGCNYQNV
jgi:hypothetical protein